MEQQHATTLDKLNQQKKKLEIDKKLETKELATYAAKPMQGAIEISSRGLQLKNLDEMFRFAQAIWQSGTAPESYKNEQAVLIAIVMGAEYGLPAMASVRGIAVIGGKPALYGGLLLGIVQKSGKMEWIKEYMEGEGDNRVAVCQSKRFDSELTVEERYSVQDAVQAGLWMGKDKKHPNLSPWYKQPNRMLKHRARTYNLNDNFADVLSGCVTAEEAAEVFEAREAFDPEKVQGAIEDKAESLADDLAPIVNPKNRAEIVAEQSKTDAMVVPTDADPVLIIDGKLHKMCPDCDQGWITNSSSGQPIKEACERCDGSGFLGIGKKIEAKRGETISVSDVVDKPCSECDGKGRADDWRCGYCGGSGRIPLESDDEREARLAQEDADVAARDADLLRSYNARKAEDGQADKIEDLTDEANAEHDERSSDKQIKTDPIDELQDDAEISDEELVQIDERYEKLVVRIANSQEISMADASLKATEWLKELAFDKKDLLNDNRWLNIWTAAKKIKPSAIVS